MSLFVKVFVLCDIIVKVTFLVMIIFCLNYNFNNPFKEGIVDYKEILVKSTILGVFHVLLVHF